MINSKKLGAILIVVLLAGLYLLLKNPFSPLEVIAQPVERKTFELTVSATATGTIKSETEAKATSETTGRITRLLIEEGDRVKKGAVIAEIDPESALINLKLSEASYEKAKALVLEAKTALESLQIEVETSIQKAEANYKEASNRLQRYKELNSKGFVSSFELDAVQRDLDVAKAVYEAALSGKKNLLAKTQEVRAREAALKEAENSLLSARLNYNYSFIKSPIDGVVSSLPVKLGETVLKGTLIATITSTDNLYVEAPIDEADVGKVKIGQSANITMDAYPGKVFKAEIYMISPIVLGARHETRTFEVRARFKEPVEVKPGMSADMEIVIDRVENALIVPSQAIIEKEGSSHLYIIKSGRAYLRKVKTGLSNWTYTEIISGLSQGDYVILNPDTSGLKDGVRVRIK